MKASLFIVPAFLTAFFCANFVDLLPGIKAGIGQRSNAPGRSGRVAASSQFFRLNVKNGEQLGTIFSRTISYKSDAFPEIVKRVSGTAIHKVIDRNPERPVFEGSARYDGRPESSSRMEVNNNGKTISYDGKLYTNTDASGMLYNSLIWGTPPANITKGLTWTVNIPQAWELGGAGTQTVTVMEIDETNHMVRLKREGYSEGFYDNDKNKVDVTKDGKTTTMDLGPGQSHWVGYTIFQNGLVISDELLVTRPVVLSSDSLQFNAQEREYILLNAMPVP